MAREFEIFGADRQSGDERWIVVTAEDLEGARRAANAAGLLVRAVRPLGPEAAASGRGDGRAAPVRRASNSARVVAWIAAIVLVVSMVWAGYCLEQMSGHEDRVQQLHDRAYRKRVEGIRRSPGANPPPMRYRVDSMSDGVLITPEYINPLPEPPPPDPKVVAERRRQANLRAGLVAAICLAALSVAGVLVAVLQLRGGGAGKGKAEG